MGRIRTPFPGAIKCACCHGFFEKSDVIPMDNKSLGGNEKRFVCRDCFDTKSYNTKNNEISHKPTKTGHTFGCELECIPHDEAGKAAMISAHYGFIPTSDCSLDVGGVEFKSPVWRNLSGLRQMFKSFQDYADFDDNSCGQHIHIGHENYNAYTAYWVREHCHELFDPMTATAQTNYTKLWNLFGRSFNHYASADIDPTDRYCWINITNDRTIELRLCKLVTPSQYISLFQLGADIMTVIIDTYKTNAYSYVAIVKAGKKIDKIFQKYLNGCAEIQKRGKKD